jgi:hypothetical protein
MAFTVKDMEKFAYTAWGDLGYSTVRKWVEFNDRYFGGQLRPIPIIITSTKPHGACTAMTGHTVIELNVSPRLRASNSTLLHEMVHQYLHQRREYAKHAGDAWCREIMRITKLIDGREIWCGRTKTHWIGGKAVRKNCVGADGQASLPQRDIARWPLSIGINLGKLGA